MHHNLHPSPLPPDTVVGLTHHLAYSTPHSLCHPSYPPSPASTSTPSPTLSLVTPRTSFQTLLSPCLPPLPTLPPLPSPHLTSLPPRLTIPLTPPPVLLTPPLTPRGSSSFSPSSPLPTRQRCLQSTRLLATTRPPTRSPFSPFSPPPYPPPPRSTPPPLPLRCCSPPPSSRSSTPTSSPSSPSSCPKSSRHWRLPSPSHRVSAAKAIFLRWCHW